MSKKLLFILPFLICFGFFAKSQGLRYSQAYVLASNINPSYTGLGNSYKFGLLHRNQWSKLPGNMLSTGLNFELSNPDGDLAGALVLNQTKSTDILVHNEVGLTARKSISFGVNNVFNFGLSALYGNYALDTEKLVFGDQLNLDGSISDVTQENIDAFGNSSYLDLMAGVSVQIKDLMIGVSGKNLTRPNTSMVDATYKQPMHFHFMSSYAIHTKLRRLPFMDVADVIELNVHPFLIFETQNGFSSIDFGGYVNFEPVLLGLKYRGLNIRNENEYNISNKDALSVILGYELEKVSLTYSYDVVFTDVSGSGGTHELGIIFRKPLKGIGKKLYF